MGCFSPCLSPAPAMFVLKWRQISPWSLSCLINFSIWREHSQFYQKKNKRQLFYTVILTNHLPNGLILVTFGRSRRHPQVYKGFSGDRSTVHQSFQRRQTRSIEEEKKPLEEVQDSMALVFRFPSYHSCRYLKQFFVKRAFKKYNNFLPLFTCKIISLRLCGQVLLCLWIDFSRFISSL